MLSERGLAAALDALILRVPLPVTLEALPAQRLPEAVEAAAFYVVAEALTNVHKHARAAHIVVRVAIDGDYLDVSVTDDGAGGADPDGHGLRGLADRVEALGGALRVDSTTGGGTQLRARLPARAASPGEAVRGLHGHAPDAQTEAFS